MPSNLHTSTALRNAQLDAVNAIIGSGGKLKLYSDAHAQPATVADALGTQVLLGTLTLSDTPLTPASAGEADFDTITSDTAADASGDASWFSITKSDGTRVIEGSVGTADADLLIDDVAIVAGALISAASMSLTLIDAV